MKLVDKVLLRRVSHAVPRGFQNFKNDSVHLQFDCLSLRSAYVPNHVNFTIVNLLFEEEKSDQVFGAVDKLVMSSLTKNLVNDP